MKSNICSIHKKSDKQVVNHCRSVWLLPACGKVFERLTFNSLYEQALAKRVGHSPHQRYCSNPHCPYEPNCPFEP